MIKVGIIGSTGYVAGELLRCLLIHPNVNIDFLYSHSQPEKKVGEIHQDLIDAELTFTNQINTEVEVLFLCLGHGNSKKFLTEHQFSKHTKIIDLSNDFRLAKDANFQDKNFIYGLVETYQQKIKQAQYIANPGCFATAIQLALLPLAKADLITDEVHVNALTGSTGAGQSLSTTSHFSWRTHNISIYKAFQHQHLNEIHETLKSLQESYSGNLNFLPLRGGFTRGIFASVYMNHSSLSEKKLIELYQAYYRDSPLVLISSGNIHLKQVVNTNKCMLQVQKIEGKILITSIIDNLLKGAAGQAIQNMNLLVGLPVNTGLQLKANYF